MTFVVCMLSRVRPNLVGPIFAALYDLRGPYVKDSSKLDAGLTRASYDLRGLYVVKGSSQPGGAHLRGIFALILCV